MRIAIGGIVHETNSHAVDSFGMTGMDSFFVRRGERVLRYEGTRTVTWPGSTTTRTSTWPSQ